MGLSLPLDPGAGVPSAGVPGAWDAGVLVPLEPVAARGIVGDSISTVLLIAAKASAVDGSNLFARS